jgi:phosphoglycolate phosphatase
VRRVVRGLISPRFQLVHLDLDGTLLDTRADLVASTNHVRATFGLGPLDPESVYHLVGRGARVLVERALGPEHQDGHDEAVRVFLAHYQEHCLDHTVAYDGMIAALDRLSPLGIRFSVVTNKPEKLTRKILDGLGLTERFAAIVGGDTFPERKPDPRGVEHVRARCAVDKDRSVMVGDSPVDAETARAAGIACCGVLWGLDPEGIRAARPAFLVASAAELAAVIEGR